MEVRPSAEFRDRYGQEGTDYSWPHDRAAPWTPARELSSAVDQAVVIFYADCAEFNFCADDLRIRHIRSMCWFLPPVRLAARRAISEHTQLSVAERGTGARC